VSTITFPGAGCTLESHPPILT